jgi:hypothetical protein
VFAALARPGHATAALRFYRALYFPWMRSREYAREQSHLFDAQGDHRRLVRPAGRF